MIPNNQWYFTSLANQIGTTINGYYNMKMLKNNAFSPWRDGAMAQRLNGKIRAFGGWNPAGGANFTPSTNEQYESADGVNWTQLADAPWNDMHFALNCGAWLGYEAWIFGGDSFSLTRKVWAYDNTSSTWIQMTADWGLNDLAIAAGCLHNNEFYIVGGRDYTTGTNNMTVYKSSNGTTFTAVSTFSNSNSAGNLHSFNGYLYFMGGATFSTSSSPGDINLYNNLVTRSRDGVTWETVATLSNEFSSAWPVGGIFDNKMWMSIGASPVGGNASNNHQLIFYTSDGITWTKLVDIFGNPTTQPHTHAAAALNYNNGLHFVGGNNDPLVSYKIEKVDLTYYNALPKNCDLILQMCNGAYTNGTLWHGTKCGQVATLNGFDTFEVGFIGGTGSNKFDIDITAVQTWAAGRDFYWSIIYDRSGNNNHAISIVGNRPQAGIAGVMTLINGKPSAYSVDGTKTFILTNPINLGTSYLMSAVLTWTASGFEFLGSIGPNKYGFYNNVGGNMNHSPIGGGVYQVGSDYTLNHQDLQEWYRDGADIQGYKNGTRLLDTTFTVGGSFTVNDLMGESSTYGFRGYFQGLVLKAGPPTLSERYSIQTFTKNYYGI